MSCFDGIESMMIDVDELTSKPSAPGNGTELLDVGGEGWELDVCSAAARRGGTVGMAG